MEHQHISSKNKTLSDYDNSPETPPPTKKKYEIMKDPAFLSSPVYPPVIPTKLQLSTNCDEYLTLILHTNRFSFKTQLTSLYVHPTDYTFKLYDKKQDFFTSSASKIMAPFYYWLDNGVKIFSLIFNFLRPSIYDLITDENDPSYRTLTKPLITAPILAFFNKPNLKITFCELQINIAFHDDKFKQN